MAIGDVPSGCSHVEFQVRQGGVFFAHMNEKRLPLSSLTVENAHHPGVSDVVKHIADQHGSELGFICSGHLATSFDSAGWQRTAGYGNVYLPYVGRRNVSHRSSAFSVNIRRGESFL
jgi:hypothetical protein